MEFRTSPDAFAMTESRAWGFSKAAFSRNRRNTFSTSTIASSTTIPMATASPPRVMEFTLMSKPKNTSIVMPKDIGMAVSVMRVVRKFSRNRNRMIVTMIAPSRIASTRLPMAWSMKSFCWNSKVVSTPFGRVVSNSASALFICSVSFRVSNPGALVMDMITP